MKPPQNWLPIVIVHATVALLSPVFACALFLILSFGLKSLMHTGGLLALAFGFVFTYFFFGVAAVATVLFGAPVLWGGANMQSRLISIVAAVVTGAGLGWTFCLILVAPGQEPELVSNAYLACTLTGALAAVILETVWLVQLKPGQT